MTVTAIPGRPFCFWVTSRSGDDDRLADWIHVSCTCPDWGMRNTRHRNATGTNFVCDHLTAAKDDVWDGMMVKVRSEVNSPE